MGILCSFDTNNGCHAYVNLSQIKADFNTPSLKLEVSVLYE